MALDYNTNSEQLMCQNQLNCNILVRINFKDFQKKNLTTIMEFP